MIMTLAKERYQKCDLCVLFGSNPGLGVFHFDHDIATYVCHDCAYHLWVAETVLSTFGMHDPSKSVNLPKSRGIDSKSSLG